MESATYNLHAKPCGSWRKCKSVIVVLTLRTDTGKIREFKGKLTLFSEYLEGSE
jgi:hypothetical protein